MKSKAALKEIVGTKIVYALLLACYYWMWARQDWHSYYDTIQNMVIIFSISFFALRTYRFHLYRKGEKDERADLTLRRIDAVLLKILAAADTIIAFACAVTFLDGRTAGYALIGTMFILAVIRFVLFCAMCKKDA